MKSHSCELAVPGFKLCGPRAPAFISLLTKHYLDEFLHWAERAAWLCVLLSS